MPGLFSRFNASSVLWTGGIVVCVVAASAFYFFQPEHGLFAKQHSGLRRLHGEVASLGEFSVRTEQAAEGSRVRMLHSGKTVLFPEEIFFAVDADPVSRDFPEGGCETLKVNLFTGGANCCFAYYVLSSCVQADHAAYIVPFDSGMRPQGTVPGYWIGDPAFMYYTPAGGEEHSFFLSRADSPRPERMLVFDRGQWRADHKGEFPEVYLEKARALALGGPQKNLEKAYYLLMAGEDREEVREEFLERLPAEFRRYGEKVFADIEAAIQLFDPVENIRLY